MFAALGFELRLDARGFAWFHNSEANSNIGKTSRQLALLFMVIFDVQANAGKALQRFTDWLIDSAWLADAHALAGKLQLFAHLFQTALRPEADRNQKDLRVAARTPGTGE